MLRKQFSLLVLSLGLLCLAGPVGATPTLNQSLTSSNSSDVLGYEYGAISATSSDWAAVLAGSAFDANGLNGSNSTFPAGGQTFAVTGANNGGGSGYQSFAGSSFVVTMPNLAALTGLALDLVGNPTVTLTLSDGSTVTTAPLSFGGSELVVFTSPLQIISASVYSPNSSTFLSDLSWGTANPADLPTQPGGDQSATPEVSTLWLMGGGLLGLSQLIRRRKHLLN